MPTAPAAAPPAAPRRLPGARSGLLLAASLGCAALATGHRPAPGEEAPALALPATDGSTVELGALRGKTVVLAFFPKAFTGG